METQRVHILNGKAIFLLVFLAFWAIPFFAEDNFGIGVGLTTDNYSVYESSFTVPVLHAYYEVQRGLFVADINFYGLNVFFPILALDAGIFITTESDSGGNVASFKLTAGYFSDVSLDAGHEGLMVSFSIIVNKSLEFKVFGVPQGMYSQPGYSIKDGIHFDKMLKNENGVFDIKNGYLGMLMCMRF